jgi:hypothetical protein
MKGLGETVKAQFYAREGVCAREFLRILRGPNRKSKSVRDKVYT